MLVAENSNKKISIRYGTSSKDNQIDCFEIDSEGNLLNDIQWDFETITDLTIYPISDKTLTIKNGNFITNALNGIHDLPYGRGYGKPLYYYRGMFFWAASNVNIDNIHHTLSEDRLSGSYFHFLLFRFSSDINVTNSSFYARKFGTKSRSTYDLKVEQCVNFYFENVTSNGWYDSDRWGFMASAYCKDFVFNNVKLNRIDAHQFIYNLTVKDSYLGYRGFTLTGQGTLKIENTTVEAEYFINLRSDYGSTWNGDIYIKDCTHKHQSSYMHKFINFSTCLDNDGTLHYFGYDLHQPDIYIENFTVDCINKRDIKNYPIIANFKDHNFEKALDDYWPKNIYINGYEILNNDNQEPYIAFLATASDKISNNYIITKTKLRTEDTDYTHQFNIGETFTENKDVTLEIEKNIAANNTITLYKNNEIILENKEIEENFEYTFNENGKYKIKLNSMETRQNKTGEKIFEFEIKNYNENKKNNDSYWSKTNSPIFYGASKVEIKKGIIDSYNPLDTRFRVFAKDFEDGDLTPQITYSGNVDVNTIGTYKINYSVIDSHGNETTFELPVTVTDGEDDKIKVERTLYTIPSVWNMDIAGFSRCNYGDRQILGVYMPEGTSVKARIISSDNDINVQFFNNDSQKEISQTIKNDNQWVTLKNTKDDYGVVENEVLTLIVPYTDKDKMYGYYSKGFNSLDAFLEYYKKVIDKMDEYVGLDLNPEKLTDQNVRTKYLIRANAHGAGSAYYAGNHVGVNNSSMASFFEMNWGGLHELAHGYQGTLGKGEMGLGEVSNNIIGHYIQIDKSIYTYDGDWLGKLSSIEDTKNEVRLNGTEYNNFNTSVQLYFIINLFDYFEGPNTYSKMFSWYREKLIKGRRTMTNQDAYVEAIAEIYNVNIIPYMEAWGLKISDETKLKIINKELKVLNILKDTITQENNLNEIMQEENISEKYTLVSNDILNKYDYKGQLKLKILIDDIEELIGENIFLKDENETIKIIAIDSDVIELENIPVGTYYLQMPVVTDYNQEYKFVKISQNSVNSYEYEYSKIDYTNYLSLKLQGIYNTYGYEITFSDYYKKATIKLGPANMGNIDCYVKIFDNKNNIVSEEKVDGIYFDYQKAEYTIDLNKGYKIEVKQPNDANKVKIYSISTGEEVPEYIPTENITTYIVTDNGIIKKAMEEVQQIKFNDQNLYTQIVKQLKDEVEFTEDEENTTIEITNEELEKVKSIKIINKQIKDVTGLEKFTSLEDLNLRNNLLKNINVLFTLENLKKLDVAHNNITQITGINDLKNLKELNLYDCIVYDLSDLEGMDKLEILNLGENNENKKGVMTNLESLNTLTNLKHLDFSENYTKDILNYIYELTNLEFLNIQNNKIDNIQKINNLKNLKELILYNNSISSIDALLELDKIEILNLQKNKITTLSGLIDNGAMVLKNLKKLNIAENKINSSDEIEFLCNKDIERQLELNYEKIVDTSSLPHVDENGIEYVTYEDFGARADGKYDDFIAIRNAHAFANTKKYEVRATKGKTYHIFKFYSDDNVSIRGDKMYE